MAEAIIVGGGIGGVAAALALQRFGWRVSVLEQAPNFSEVGAGIQVSPNGYKVLEALGLGAAIEAQSFEPTSFNFRIGRTGRSVFSVPSKAHFRSVYGAPYLQVHRADLLQCLMEALSNSAPGALRAGARVESYHLRDGRAHVALENGEVLAADLVIGADGVRSRMREAMLGSEKPRFTGNVAWRAVVETAALGDLDIPPGPCVWAGPGRHAVTYPLRDGSLVNFVGVVEHSDWREESWTQQAAKAEALADFADWSPVIERIIERSASHFRWALFDRDPLPRWTDGPVALLGDACHPMLPTLAQGACQALEDAWALAQCVSGAEDLAEALQRYEALRKPRTARIQLGARRMARLFHLSGLPARVSEAALSLAGWAAPEFLLKRNAWIYECDVAAIGGPPLR